MHLLRALLVASCPALAAQSLTTTWASTHHLVSHDGGVYFDLAVQNELHLDRLDVNLFSPVGASGTVEVWVRPGPWLGNVEGATDWVRAASGAVTAAGANQPTPCVLSVPVGLPAGSHGIALHFLGVMPLYTFAFAPRSYANADLRLTGGGSALQFLVSAPFQWRVWNGTLHYTLGGGPYLVAAAQRYGEGCLQGARSFHETFAPGGFDLAGRRLVLTPNGSGGHDAVLGAAPGLVLPPGAQNLGLQRHGFTTVSLPVPLAVPGGTTTLLAVYADGRVLASESVPIGAGALLPSPAALFADQPLIAVAWQDLAPAGSDNVWAAVDGASGTTTIVWWNVPTHGAAGGGNTFALRVHADGSLELEWAAVANPAGACLVGFGAGLGARDPGPRDLSAATAFATQRDDPGLGLFAGGRPVLGATMPLSVRDRPATALGTALLFGLQPRQPGLDLAAFGAPGCALLVEWQDAVTVWLAGAAQLGFPVPADAGLLGAGCHAQAAAWVPAVNALGVLTSNGLALRLGSV